MDLESILAPLMGLTAGIPSLGIDGAIILAINEKTNQLKDWIKGHEVDKRFTFLPRLYPFIPFGIAFGINWITAGLPISVNEVGGVALTSFWYWVASLVGFNVFTRSVVGK